MDEVGGGNGSSGVGANCALRWDGDAAHRRRQDEDLTERSDFVGELTERAKVQAVGNVPSVHREDTTPLGVAGHSRVSRRGRGAPRHEGSDVGVAAQKA